MEKRKYFKNLVGKILPHVELQVLQKNDFDFSLNESEYRLKLVDDTNIFLYRKINKNTYSIHMPASIEFCPIFDMEIDLEKFNVEQYLKDIYYYTKLWF